jgi:hypothetical protein
MQPPSSGRALCTLSGALISADAPLYGLAVTLIAELRAACRLGRAYWSSEAQGQGVGSPCAHRVTGGAFLQRPVVRKRRSDPK